MTIASHGYLLVFCDDRDTVAPNGELHANFKLGASGEYLALLKPDNTVVSEYSPEFPPQIADVSYGVSTSLVGAGATAKVFIPTDNSLGTTWQGACGKRAFLRQRLAQRHDRGGLRHDYAHRIDKLKVAAQFRILHDARRRYFRSIGPYRHECRQQCVLFGFLHRYGNRADAAPRTDAVQCRRKRPDDGQSQFRFLQLHHGNDFILDEFLGHHRHGHDGAVLFDMRSSRGMLITADRRRANPRPLPIGNRTARSSTKSSATASGQRRPMAPCYRELQSGNSGSACSIYIDGRSTIGKQ